MRISVIESIDRTECLINDLITLWNQSVRASHHFLSEDDIEKLTLFVRAGLTEVETLAVSYDEGTSIAFIGVSCDKIEMLFVAPDFFGKGIGRKLVEFSKKEYKVKRVDANEQNIQAVGFYQRMGFRVVERSEIDEEGNHFPILRMQSAMLL